MAWSHGTLVNAAKQKGRSYCKSWRSWRRRKVAEVKSWNSQYNNLISLMRNNVWIVLTNSRKGSSVTLATHTTVIRATWLCVREGISGRVGKMELIVWVLWAKITWSAMKMPGKDLLYFPESHIYFLVFQNQSIIEGSHNYHLSLIYIPPLSDFGSCQNYYHLFSPTTGRSAVPLPLVPGII